MQTCIKSLVLVGGAQEGAHLLEKGMKSIPSLHLLGPMILSYAIPPILACQYRDSASPSYKLLFGGVLGQELANTTRDDEGTSAAIQIALDQINEKKTDHHHNVIKTIRKQRMLFSINGTHPHIFKQRSMSQNGKMLVQNIQLVLGLLYHVSISQNGGDHLCKECRHLEHDLILTRDRNKEFHIFQHTTRHSEMASTGSSMSDWHENCTCPLLLPTTQSSSGEGGLETSQQETVLWSDNSHHPYSSHLSLHSPLHVVQKHTPEHCTANPGQEGCKVQTMDKGYQLHPLRVASYNIWNVNSLSGVEESYDGRITRLGKFISSLDADIIGFQEVRLEVFHRPQTRTTAQRKGFTTQPQVSQLSKYLPGFQYVYQPAMLYTDRLPERSEEGVSIFSRFPILSSDYILLYRNISDGEDNHQRVCLHAEILTPHFGRVHVFVTHLSLSKASQEKSVIEIWKFMEKFSGIKLLMGDLNNEPHSPTIRFLAGEVSLEGIVTHNLLDMWTAVESNQNKNGFTFSALDSELVKRIDYIFMGQSDPPTARVVKTDVMNSGKYCNIPCSDHLALVTELLPVIHETL